MALRTEILVVGAGPAGGVAALELANQGARVMVVDRSSFPREKICGDGLVEDSLKILTAAGVGAAVKNKAHSTRCIRFCAPNGSECELKGRFYTLRRKDLDALVMEEACTRGAEFHDDIKIVRPLLQGGELKGAVGVSRRGYEVRISAEVVLLATGSNAGVLRRFGVLKDKGANAVGLRAYFRPREPLDESTMIVSYDHRLLPGYVWMFPMGGGIFNVGCGIFLDGGRKVRRLIPNLAGFFKQIEPLAVLLRQAEQLTPIRAAAMRTGFRGSRACGSRVLVLGEALGLTFPFIGEGISNALESGRLASAVVVEALAKGDFSKQSLGHYERELRRLLERRHQGYLTAQRWFRFRPLANLLIEKAARSRAVRKVARQILCGQRHAGEVFSLGGLARVLLIH